MPSFELNKLQPIAGVRSLSDTDRASVQTTVGTRAEKGSANAASNGASGVGGAGVSIEIGTAVNPMSPPVNSDRVSDIRQALREGTYPLIPTEISDAMIAAQLSFEIDR